MHFDNFKLIVAQWHSVMVVFTTFVFSYANEINMKYLLIALVCLSLVQFPKAQSYTVTLADSFFVTNNWKKSVDAYTWLIENSKTTKPGIAWYRIAIANYTLHSFTNAIHAFKNAIAYSKNPLAMYNLACSFNQLGLKDSCYVWLQTALEKGFSGYDKVILNEDLSTLRNEERFKVFLNKLKAIDYPCSSSPEYRQFDFWIGEWNVFDTKTGNPAGKSKIELLLRECVLMENWQPISGIPGKSFNMYNASEKKWRQTYVDASGTLLEFYDGEYRGNKMQFKMKSGPDSTLHKLTFFKINDKEIRQLGELLKGKGSDWQVEYDLTYKK